MFWKDPSVLYISTHQDGSFPGTGKVESLGADAGEGFTVNVPLPASSGDAALTRANALSAATTIDQIKII